MSCKHPEIIKTFVHSFECSCQVILVIAGDDIAAPSSVSQLIFSSAVVWISLILPRFPSLSISFLGGSKCPINAGYDCYHVSQFFHYPLRWWDIWITFHFSSILLYRLLKQRLPPIIFQHFINNTICHFKLD